MVLVPNSNSRKEECDDERFLLTFSRVCLVQVCPAVAPQFFTNWAHQAQYATHAHAFLLSFFVTVENKRFAKPTPKRKVARWNRAGGTSFPKEIRNLTFLAGSRAL